MSIKDEIDVLVDRIEEFSADVDTMGKIARLFQEEIVGKKAPSWRKEVANDRLFDFYPALVILIDDLISEIKGIESHAFEIRQEVFKNEQN